MLNGWVAPAAIITLIGWSAGAVWWASGTDTKVQQNTTSIEQVIKNEKHIAVIQVQQAEIVKDIGEIKDDNKEVKKMVNDILQTVNGWSNDE